MFTSDELNRLMAEDPAPMEGESQEAYAKRYSAFYDRFAYKVPKGKQTVVPVVTITPATQQSKTDQRAA